MLKKNILATNSIYVSISHNKNILKKYFSILNNLFDTIAACEVEMIFTIPRNKCM